jgi:8-oxo-dGTP diphosphatase
MDWLVDLDELESDVAHRPGKLYRFNTAHLKDVKDAQLLLSEDHLHS